MKSRRSSSFSAPQLRNFANPKGTANISVICSISGLGCATLTPESIALQVKAGLKRARAELHFVTLVVDHERIQQANQIHSYHERRPVIQLPELEDVKIAEGDIEMIDPQIAHLNRSHTLSLAALF